MSTFFSSMDESIRGDFATWWGTAATVAGLDSLPPLVGETVGPFTIRLETIWDIGEDEGTIDAPIYRCPGILQISVTGPKDRKGTMKRLCDRFRDWSKAAKGQITGLRIYGTSPPRRLNADAGKRGYHVDVRVLWLASG